MKGTYWQSTAASAVSLACQTGSFLGFPLQQAAIMLFAAVCGKSCQNS